MALVPSPHPIAVIASRIPNRIAFFMVCPLFGIVPWCPFRGRPAPGTDATPGSDPGACLPDEDAAGAGGA
jgi:hypothetical protein